MRRNRLDRVLAPPGRLCGVPMFNGQRCAASPSAVHHLCSAAHGAITSAGFSQGFTRDQSRDQSRAAPRCRGPNLAEMGPSLARTLGQVWADFDPHTHWPRPSWGRWLPNLGRCQPDIGRFRPALAEHGAEPVKIGPMMAKVGPSSAKIGPISEEVGHVLPELAELGPVWVVMSAALERPILASSHPRRARRAPKSPSRCSIAQDRPIFANSG